MITYSFLLRLGRKKKDVKGKVLVGGDCEGMK
jgi:hypothetical protein